MKVKKKNVQIAVDTAMTIPLPVLMAYSLIGELFHEIAGTTTLILFVAHHIINRKSTAAMFRGRQTPERIFVTVINILLFIFMIMLPLSGIAMSRYLYAFLPTNGLSATARTVHLLTSYRGVRTYERSSRAAYFPDKRLV